MRCMTVSKRYGHCVLDTHLTGRHVNSQGATWDVGHGTQRRRGKQYWCYLNSADGGLLQEIAAEEGTSTGAIIKELVQNYLAAHRKATAGRGGPS